MIQSRTLLVLALLTALDQPALSAVESAVSTPPPERGVEVLVAAGLFRPLDRETKNEEPSRVDAFWLDRDPVTNESFRRFVAHHPRFRRGRISSLFADAGYLSHWAAPLELGQRAGPHQPVTRVSWFAAKAYCHAQGKRLPTELEWEYAASASETSPDARRDPAWKERVLSWYGKPATRPLSDVGASPPSYYGVRDLHGLIWEWVLDYNGTLVSSDTRGSGERDTRTFCGAGALGFGDASDYASFMRTAFRSALSAAYTAQSLGFRCARDAS